MGILREGMETAWVGRTGMGVVKGRGRNEIGGWWVMEIRWIDDLLDCSIDTFI